MTYLLRIGLGFIGAGLAFMLSSLTFYTVNDLLGLDGSMVPVLLWLLVTPFVAFAGFVHGFERKRITIKS